MMTTVWRCEPRSHGRNKAASPLPGRRPSVAVPHRSASPALCPCGHVASFRRRSSSCLVPVVRRRVRGTSGRSASAACGVRGVRAAQQRGSRRNDSSKQAKRLEHHDVVEEVARKRIYKIA